ncbi:hypothetical protein FX985_03223 [Pseudomonas extremaustralis]|uniref:Uncharacterized protein n=1 Tax=Pseudomonas extremaustralis TaxID=359110 RepID=A0A5M9J6G5_9PSED|nr:hypothetical protein [Pseudomonas extremaustralis]KAA8563155.1 hypothetical protein FX985_03223 [Pseudomonas extremaustralis]
MSAPHLSAPTRFAEAGLAFWRLDLNDQHPTSSMAIAQVHAAYLTPYQTKRQKTL